MATKGDIEAVTLLTRLIFPSLEEVPSYHDTDALLSDNAIGDSEQGEGKDTEGESSVRLGGSHRSDSPPPIDPTVALFLSTLLRYGHSKS